VSGRSERVVGIAQEVGGEQREHTQTINFSCNRNGVFPMSTFPPSISLNTYTIAPTCNASHLQDNATRNDSNRLKIS
jgi:hypothetical protein